MLLFLAAYLVYGASRWVVTGDQANALEHARWIVELEETLGVALETSVQQGLDGTAVLWLLTTPTSPHRSAGSRRRWSGSTGVTSRPIAACATRCWPPGCWRYRCSCCCRSPHPRLAGLGIADTITQQTGLALDSKLTTSFYNPLAAVPSLHCGFALAVSLALAGSARRRWTRALALAWAPAIFLAGMSTGNPLRLRHRRRHRHHRLGFGVAQLVAGRREPAARRPDARPALAMRGGRGE